MNSNELNIDLGAYNLGKQSAKSFLLAGERNLISGLSRKGTDEEKFDIFFKKLDDPNKKLLKKYFTRQANLSLSQRVKVLGDYTDLKIEDKLTLKTGIENLVKDRFASQIGTTSSVLKKAILIPKLSTLGAVEPQEEEKKEEAIFDRLSLYLHWVDVQDLQDSGRGWQLWNNSSKADEGTLGVIIMDETGEISSVSRHLGSLKKGITNFNPLRLATVLTTEGGDHFPKTYHFQVIAIERDSNKQWNTWLDAMADYAKEKVTTELISRGVIQAGAAAKIPIPPPVAAIIASFVKGYVDNLIGWIASMASDSDDIIATKTLKYVVNDYKDGGTGTFGRMFSGSGGRWNLAFSFDMSKSISD